MNGYSKTTLEEVLTKHLKWLRKENGGERADLSGSDLRGADLSYSHLACANMSGADLSGANLHMAQLAFADLSGANLTGADLSCADLRYVDLLHANLTGANLSGITPHLTSDEIRSLQFIERSIWRANREEERSDV